MSVEELKEQIEKDIENNTILLYIKGEKEIPMCGYSQAAVNVFKELGAPVETRNVLDDLPTYREALKSVTNWPTIPQIFIDGEFIGGCDITVELYKSGELKEKVDAALETQES